MTSAASHHVKSRFQPPLSGGSLCVRATRLVDQSIALRMTLKPIDSSRWRDDRRGVEERNVGDVEHHDRPTTVARLLPELPRSCEVVLHDRLVPAIVE